MNSPDLNPEVYRHDLEVVRNTAQQVIHDFGLAGFEITFSGMHETAYIELKQQVIPALKEVFKKNPGAFLSLLYRIDVDEKKVKSLMQTAKNEEFINQLSELILEREFMKALTRKLFSQKNERK